MKDIRMRRAVPFIPAILDSHRRKEYTPQVAQPRIRVLPEEAQIPPRLEGNEGKRDSVIEVLVMANRSGDVVRSLMQLRHRLRRESTIVVIHGGMGALAEVQSFWPDEAQRPNIVEGFSTHGLSKRDEFTVDHWGQGKLHLAIAPRLDESDIFAYTTLQQDSLPQVIDRLNARHDIRLQYLDRGNKYKSLLFILRQLLSNEVLSCTLRAYFPNFYLLQLRRTILQSILQLLGTIQHATNQQLVTNKINHKIIGRLLLELLPVLRADPLIASSPVYTAQFSFSRLYSQIRIMALTNPHHMNALAQDVTGKRESELSYFSGFLLRLGRQRGVKLAMWRILHEQVKAIALGEQMRANESPPVVNRGEEEEVPEWTYGVRSRYWRRERYEELVDTVRRPTAVEMLEKEKMEERMAEVIEEVGVREQMPEKQTVSVEERASEEPSAEESPSEYMPSPLTQRLRVTSVTEDSTRQRTIVNVPNLKLRISPTQRKPRRRGRLTDRIPSTHETQSRSRESHTGDELTQPPEWRQRITRDPRDTRNEDWRGESSSTDGETSAEHQNTTSEGVHGPREGKD